ncbi:MAG: hypothetical protein KAX10_02390 [Candidatus Lokiarchaeota archaeon]|nr:hypothetical protein [Candidatus Lokiarchaeota archaeon]
MVELNFLGVFKKTTFNNEEPPLFELRDLTIFKYPQKINYHKIIKEFDISPYFIEEKTPKDITDKKKEEKTTDAAINKIEKFLKFDFNQDKTTDEKINEIEAEKSIIDFQYQNQLEYPGLKLIFTYIFGTSFFIVLISNFIDDNIKDRLKKCLTEIESKYSPKSTESLERNDIFDYFLNIVLEYFAERVILNFLVPDLTSELAFYENKNKEISELIESSTSEEDINLISHITGLESVESIVTKHSLELSVFKKQIFKLWIANKIYLRFNPLKSDDFLITSRGKEYLVAGRKNEQALTEEFKDKKIIGLLTRFDKPNSLQKILAKSNLNEYSARLYMRFLINKNLVDWVEYCPKIEPVTEEEIPLLLMKGFEEEDLDFLHHLEKHFDGNCSLHYLSSLTEQSPQKIKQLLNLLEKKIKH